jgi:hypothetical protein
VKKHPISGEIGELQIHEFHDVSVQDYQLAFMYYPFWLIKHENELLKPEISFSWRNISQTYPNYVPRMP